MFQVATGWLGWTPEVALIGAELPPSSPIDRLSGALNCTVGFGRDAMSASIAPALAIPAPQRPSSQSPAHGNPVAGSSGNGVALVSGAIAGIAGVSEVAGIQFRLTSGISAGYGYTGIVVAMLGGLSMPGVLLSALFLGDLRVGTNKAESALDIPSQIVAGSARVTSEDILIGTELASDLVFGGGSVKPLLSRGNGSFD